MKSYGNVDKSPRYFPPLDGLRAICATMVVVSHAFREPAILTDVYHPLYAFIPQLGHVGVDIFFSLSGFLITYLLLSEHQELGRVDLKAFYVRRTLRIWPNYYTAVVGGFGLAALLGKSLGTFSAASFLTYLGFFGNLTMLIAPVAVEPLWSVCVEEQFYLLFPITFVFSKRRFPVLAAATIGLLVAASIRASSGWSGAAIYQNTFSHSDNLLLGAVLAQAFHASPDAVTRFFRRSSPAGELLAVIALVAFMYASAWLNVTVSYTTLAVITSFLVGQIAFGGGPIARMLSLPPLRFLGQLTYATYCFHMYAVILAWIMIKRLGIGPWPAGFLRAAIAIVMAFLIAYLCRITYELPVLRLKKRFHPRTIGT